MFKNVQKCSKMFILLKNIHFLSKWNVRIVKKILQINRH